MEFLVRSNWSHYILGSRGIGGRVRDNNAYCSLLRMAHLLIFIHNGGICKGTIQPRLKNGTHFPRYESLPKGYNVQMSDCLLSHKMLRHAMVSDKPCGLSVQPPPPPGKLAAQ